MKTREHTVAVRLDLNTHDIHRFTNGKLMDLETNLFKYRAWCRKNAKGKWRQELLKSVTAEMFPSMHLLFIFEDPKDAFHFRLAHDLGA